MMYLFCYLLFFYILDLCPFCQAYQVSGFQVGAEVNVFSSLMFSRIPSRPFLSLYWKYIFFFLSVCNKKHPPGQVFNRNICQEMDIQCFQCTLCYIPDSLAQFLILEIILCWFSDLYGPLYCQKSY